MQSIKNNKLAKAITNKIIKKAKDIWYKDKNEALEELQLKVYALAKEIGEHSDIEIEEISDKEISDICAKAFKKGWDEIFRYRTNHKFTGIFSSKKQTLSKKAAYPFYEMVKDTSPLYTPNDPIGVQSDEHNTTIDEMKPNLTGIDYETEFALAGLSNKYPNVKIDLGQVEKGIKVEMEHTSNKQVALKIALDHLAEISNYYDLLEEMENKAKEMGTFNKEIKEDE